MRVSTVIFICTVIAGCCSNPLPSSTDLDKSETVVDPSTAVESAGEEVTRKKKSTTTFCVEIRPSSPSQLPFQVCEPQAYSQNQQATSYEATQSSSAHKDSHAQSYGNKEYASAPSKPAAPSQAYSAPASSSAAYAAPSKTYSAPAPSHASDAYSSKDHASAAYQQHTPYTSVTSYRNAEDVDMMSRMGSIEEEDEVSRSAEDMSQDHIMREAYGEYGGVSSYGGASGYGGASSYGSQHPVALITPLPKHKKKILAKKLGKLGGHNGLVISCQPSLTGYASSVPTSGGYSAGYRSSTPTSASYRPQYGPSSYGPSKQYPSQVPSYKPSVPAYPPIAYKQPEVPAPAQYGPSYSAPSSYSSYSSHSFGGPSKQEDFAGPAASSFQQGPSAQSYGSSYGAQHASASAGSQQQAVFQHSHGAASFASSGPSSQGAYGPSHSHVASYGSQQIPAYGSQPSFEQSFEHAHAHAEIPEVAHFPESSAAGYGPQAHFPQQPVEQVPVPESYAKPSAYVRPGTYRSTNSLETSDAKMKSATGELKNKMELGKERSSDLQTPKADVEKQETESKARSASGGGWRNSDIDMNVETETKARAGGGWRASDVEMSTSMKEVTDDSQVPIESDVNNLL